MMGWLKEILTENRRTVAAWPEWKRRVGMSRFVDKKSYDQLMDDRNQRIDENAQLKAELAQCQADKDEMVRRNKLLRDRPDLPMERLAAYDEVILKLEQATQRVSGYDKQFAKCEEIFRRANIEYDGDTELGLRRLFKLYQTAKQALEEAGT